MAKKRVPAKSVVRQQLARERARRRTLMAAGIALVLILVAGIAGWYVYQSQRPEPVASGPPAGADESGVKVGTGPVTVDVYLDFMCPVCRDFESRAGATLDGLVANGKATIV
jgi:protein-disulfide isomerase